MVTRVRDPVSCPAPTHPPLNPLWPLIPSGLFTQTWFAWAVSIVNSRALTIQGEKYLVPFADMFNYAPHKVTCVWVAMAMGAVFVRACARARVCVGGGGGAMSAFRRPIADPSMPP